MKKRKVIIDCDPGIDDSLAIMLALKSPEIEVIGITIVCGNSPVEMGFGNAKKILKQMNRLDVPVYIGESTPYILCARGRAGTLAIRRWWRPCWAATGGRIFT